MKQYRKKPVVIEAVMWDGTPDTLMDLQDEGMIVCRSDEDTTGIHALSIKTLEGQYLVHIGEFIIKGVKDEFYPCKPDIFEMTYEEV